MLGEVGIFRFRSHHLECHPIILADRSRNVVVQTTLLGIRDPTADEFLKFRLRPLIWGPTISTTIWAPTWNHFRHIADGIPDCYLRLRFLRPLELQISKKSYKDESLTKLRNSVTPRVYDTERNAISNLLKLLNHASENEHLIIQRHVWNIFHDHGFRTSKLNDL